MADLEIIKRQKCHYIRIKKDNPLLNGILGNRKVAIYFERSYDEKANDFFHKEYNVILDFLNRIGVAFVYAPMWIEELDESIGFNFPDSSNLSIGNKISVDNFYKLIDESLVTKPVLDLPMILVSDPENVAGYPSEMLGDDKMGLYCYYIEGDTHILNHYNHDNYPCIFKHPSPIRFQKVDTGNGSRLLFRDGDDSADVAPQDRADWGDIETLSYEIKDRIQRLYDMGLNEDFIRQILSLPEAKLSPIIITDDFRILLPDYNNKEIQMAKLDKALYFFYLRHKEGVLFKHLRDYRRELFDIYCTISPRENLDAIERSIDDLVDSTKNSVNEKCSRIKAAFASQFQDKLANQYYIIGKRGEPKRITLDRSLVEDQSGMIM